MKKITVNTGQVMFSGEIYYYWTLNSSENVDKIVGKTSICIIYCVTNAVAVMYSRNIPIAEKRIVFFQSKKSVILISNNYYIYFKRYFEIYVTNDFLVYSGGQLL